MANPYSQRAYLGKTREEVVLEYAPLVRQLANRLAARLPENLDRGDLIQAGMIGLLDAIEKYDPGKQAQFRTYAEFRIKGAMLDDLRACDWVPRSVRENADLIGHAMQALTAQLGRLPDEAEVAAKLKLSLADYHALLLKSRAISLLSIEELRGHGDEGDLANVFDVLEDPYCTDPLDALSLSEMHRSLAEAIKALPEKEQLVLSLYYDEELNLKEIGQVLGITESRVCQIRTQIIIRLRQALKSVATPDQLDRLLEKRVQ